MKTKDPISFEQWQQTAEGKATCDLSKFKSLPQKHHSCMIAKLKIAFMTAAEGVHAVYRSQQQETLFSELESLSAAMTPKEAPADGKK